MAKVFLSVLGSSEYREVEYRPLPGEGETDRTPYVQEARLQALAAQGVGVDRVLIAVTGGLSGSEEQNFLQRLCSGGSKPDGLELRLRGLGHDPIPLRIPDGATEAQLWEIFHQLNQAVAHGDELFVDVTHGFRTLPIVVLMALDYLQRAKNVQVVQVTYGAFAAGTADSLDIHPTFDLTPFFVLQEWSSALVLLEAGDLRALGLVLERACDDLGRVLGKDRPASLRHLPGSLQRLGDDLWCNRLRDLPCHLDNTAKNLTTLRDDLEALSRRAKAGGRISRVVGALQPLRAVLGKLEAEIGKLVPLPGDPELVYGVLAALYCVEHGLVVQGLTLLRESLLDYLIERLECQDLDRRAADGLIGSLAAAARPEGPSRDRVNEEAGEAFDRLHQPPHGALGGAENYADLAKLAGKITELRNQLDHAGADGDPNNRIPKTEVLVSRGRDAATAVLALARSLPRHAPR